MIGNDYTRLKHLAKSICELNDWNTSIHITLNYPPKENQIDTYIKQIAAQNFCDAVYGFTWYKNQKWRLSMLIKRNEHKMALINLSGIKNITRERLVINYDLNKGNVIRGLTKLLRFYKGSHNYYSSQLL